MTDNELVPSRPVGEPMIIEAVERKPPAYMLDMGDPVFWTNIDIATDEGKAMVMRCYGDTDASGNDQIGKVWLTKWLLSHPVEITDKVTGEIRICVRTVLVNPEGKTLAFVSTGVLRSLRVMVFIYKRGPWDPALPLEVHQIPLADGKRTYSLQVATPPSKQPKGGK